MARKKKKQILYGVTIEDYAAEGKSIAKVEGKVIFVERTIPGDIVDIKLTRNKKDWAEGWPVEYKQLSPLRIEPFCTHFGVCGGCNWQMLPYSLQLTYKQKQVADSLQRIGKIDVTNILPIIGATGQTQYYRNKIEYTFSNKQYLTKEELSQPQISNMQNVAGFHAKGIYDKIVDLATCHLQDEIGSKIRLAVKDFAIKNDYSFYDINEHTGLMRNMQIRLCTTGDIMVNIIFGQNEESKIKKLLVYVKETFPAITTLLFTINGKWNDSIYDQEPIVYYGNGFAKEKLEDFIFKIGPKSFFQTNTKQAEKLYQVTRHFAELTGQETVYDLYCGTGSIGIFVSKMAKKIIGVELIPDAINDAIENALLNEIPHCHFFAGDVLDICDTPFFEKNGYPDVIITDPPRAGMQKELVDKILEIAAPIVVYVSCNPATQARDLQLLSEKYTVTKIQPVDMFPHTLHIENVVQLKLKPSF